MTRSNFRFFFWGGGTVRPTFRSDDAFGTGRTGDGLAVRTGRTGRTGRTADVVRVSVAVTVGQQGRLQSLAPGQHCGNAKHSILLFT